MRLDRAAVPVVSHAHSGAMDAMSVQRESRGEGEGIPGDGTGGPDRANR